MWEWLAADATWTWFTAPFADQTWWSVLNSGIVTTAISGAVGIYLATRVARVANAPEREERSRQLADRGRSRAADLLADADVDTDSISAERQAGGDFADVGRRSPADAATFHRASSAIRRLKDWVDALADRVKDGRTRRKYNNIGRRDYRVITAALFADGGLAKADYDKVVGAFEGWLTYRTGRVAVPEDVAKSLETLANRLRVTTSKPPPWQPKRAEEPAGDA